MQYAIRLRHHNFGAATIFAAISKPTEVIEKKPPNRGAFLKPE
jgi:hypothetical protein